MKFDYTISILGLGQIGRSLLFSLISDSDSSYLINVIDVSEDLSGTLLDFKQALQTAPHHKISFNSWENFRHSHFIFHCAGVGVQPGASRLSIARDNVQITKEVFQEYVPNDKAKVIVITNPVDVISYYTWKYSHLPPKQVIGTGTFLDTIRLKYYISEMVGDGKNIDVLTLGEHGDSLVWVKSHSKIDGNAVADYFTERQMIELEQNVIQTASRIKKTQGATIYAVTNCAIQLMKAMIYPDDQVYSVSCMVDDYFKNLLKTPPLYMGLPVRIDQDGVKELLPLRLNDDELTRLQASATLIKSHL